MVAAGRAAQQKAEEAVQAYFVLSAEEKRAYMRVSVRALQLISKLRTFPVCRASFFCQETPCETDRMTCFMLSDMLHAWCAATLPQNQRYAKP